MIQLHCGSSLDVLATFADNSVDSIVTDPPYGLNFMGRKWDYDVPSVEIWEQCLRVLKPGGHLLAFAGTRTQHRMAVNIEDAGFEIRDMIAWVYGCGFPKGKSCLKPALEPITMARKRAKKVQPLNIDECRVGSDTIKVNGYKCGGEQVYNGIQSEGFEGGTHKGRWPANLIHDGSDDVVGLFPREAGAAGPVHRRNGTKSRNIYGAFAGNIDEAGSTFYADSGSAARFFYCPKANKKDREDGNNHPTVKPTDLMAYLVRLVTPPGGVVLDPFMGSGSTGKAAMREGFSFIGIDREEEYVSIASERLQVIQRSILASRSADQNG